MKVFGQLVDIHKRDIYPCVINILKGKIDKIERIDSAPEVYIMPGLIDSHIHIESSMITPGAFGCAAVKHGTIGVVSDPHEIANVLGLKGIRFMMNDGKKVPLKFWFGASPCVPATAFETSGAVICKSEIQELMDLPEIKYMAEMMNFPGVVNDDKDVIEKLEIARNHRKPIDGHAPGISGEMLRKYINAGISTDHECSSIEEAEEKIALGMKILIREGSAAKNMNSLKDLFKTNPEKVMLCCDDLHPEMLKKRHINKLISALISEGFNEFDVIRSATINPVDHYKLEAGLLRRGDNADFIIVDDLKKMNIIETWINGKKIFADGKVLFKYKPGKAVNNFKCDPISESEIRVINQFGKIRIIEAFDGELVTGEIIGTSGTKKSVESDIDSDILKIIVKERYNDSPPVTGFIKGFGLKKGAFASSIAHDSHNIIAVGANDKDIVSAINEVVRQKGGLAVSSGEEISYLKLDIGGIMTNRSCDEVAYEYEKLSEQVKSFGCKMTAPFMTLSFMALLVIPALKIGDKGLFDVKTFRLAPLFVD